MSRLDRFLVSNSWLNSWVDLSQWGLPRSVSDHCPVVLRKRVCNWGPKPFRLLDCWRGLPGYREFVTSTWMEAAVNGRKAYVLKEKLKQIKNQLRVLNKDHCGDISHNIDNVRKELDQLDKKQEDVGLEEHDIARRRTCLVNFNRLSRMHCNLLRQKSRFKWLREGDSNSKFFHSCLAKKRIRDEILCLDFGGELVDGVQELKGKVKYHFQSLFAKSADWDRPHIDSLPVGQISEFDGDGLAAVFSEDEIRAVVWDCEGQKSPSPNSINFSFIKDFWDILKSDFIAFLEEFHVNGKLVRGSNSSFICLVPKKDNPQKVGDYRPISLIGCMYKVLAKLLANRLMKVMSKVISEFQTAFVKNRQILDGVVIANELVEEARRNRKSTLFFKVDFEKAYDSVSWDFLDYMMMRMNFPFKWRRWIWECFVYGKGLSVDKWEPNGRV